MIIIEFGVEILEDFSVFVIISAIVSIWIFHLNRFCILFAGWSQHAHYFKEKEDIQVPYVHALCIRDFCNFLGELRDKGNNVVLGMKANHDAQDGKVTKVLMEIGIFKVLVSNHSGESNPATCATNTQPKPIDSIWTSPGLTVLRCDFLPFHDVYSFQSEH